MSKKLSNQIRTEVGTEIDRTADQQLGGLMVAALDPEIQSSLNIFRTDWIASREGRMAQSIEKIALTTISPLSSDLTVSIVKQMSGQVPRLVASQLLTTDVVENTFRAQVKHVLPLSLQPSLYETQSGYSLEHTLN